MSFLGLNNSQVINALLPLTKYGTKMEEQQRADDAQAMMNENISNLLGLVDDYQSRYDESTGNIDNLFENNPTIDLSSFSNQLGKYSTQLGGLSSQLGSLNNQLGSYKGELSGYQKDLSGIRSGTESDVSKYLTKGEGYISSMLDEATQGADKYLKQYQKLANTEMPGMSVYRDQEQASLGSSLQQLKSMGGTSSGAIGALLGGSEQAKANLAIQAANYKSQSSRDLANAYLTSGNTKSGAYSTATGLTQNQAGIRQNLGQFSAGIVGQQSNLTSQKANITGQQSGIIGQQAGITGQQASMAETEFQNNEMTPWLQELQWNETQAMASDPLAYQSQVYGSLAGMGNSNLLSAWGSQSQTQQSIDQNNMSVINMIMKLGGGAK